MAKYQVHLYVQIILHAFLLIGLLSWDQLFILLAIGIIGLGQVVQGIVLVISVDDIKLHNKVQNYFKGLTLFFILSALAFLFGQSTFKSDSQLFYF